MLERVLDMAPPMLTLADLERLLAGVGGKLSPGGHAAGELDSAGARRVNARELRSMALGLLWTSYPDRPEAVTGSLVDAACATLEDAPWPETDRDAGAASRTRGCLPLGLLTEHGARADWPLYYRANLTARVLSVGLSAFAYLHPDPAHKGVLTAFAGMCAAQGASVLPSITLPLLKALTAYEAGKVLLKKKDTRDFAVLPLLVAARRLRDNRGPWLDDADGRSAVSALSLVPRDVLPICDAARALGYETGPTGEAVLTASVLALTEAVCPQQ